jgi:lysylphosphatidylglycerol synthetase-like protein (DUF2156 family)
MTEGEQMRYTTFTMRLCLTITSLFFLLGTFLMPSLSFAANPTLVQINKGLVPTNDAAGLRERSPAVLVGQTASVLIGVLGIVLFILFFYAGILYLTARGEGEQVTKAKAMMVNSIIGLVITLAAFSVAQFVTARLQEAFTSQGEQAAQQAVPAPEVISVPIGPQDSLTEYRGQQELPVLDF